MIFNKYVEDNNVIFDKISDFTSFIGEKISFKSIFFILLTFVLTNQTFITDIPPFIFVLFGVASLFDVPLILLLISSIVSMMFGSFSNVMLAKVLSFFVLFTLVTSLLNIEGVSKKHSVFIKFLLSFTVIETVFLILDGSLILNFFAGLGNILIVAVLYYIFASGIHVIINKSNTFISSKEESVAMIIVLCLAMTVFSGVNVYMLSLSNILILMIILMYGWKNGPITACAAGVVSGLFVSCINGVGIEFIIILGIAGLASGIFSKFGKLAIIISFIIGGVYISYYTNNFTDIVARIAEMLIASLSILFIPKKMELKLENLFNKGQALDKPYENMLAASNTIKNKIGAISEVFESLADIKLENTEDDMLETRNVIKRYITNYTEQNCIACPKKLGCSNNKNIDMIVDYIANKLENNEEITPSMLPYECDFSTKLINDIQEVYNSMKLMRILKKRERESSAKLSRQYKEISNILNNISNSIEINSKKEDKVQELLRNELKLYGYTIYEDEFKKQDNDIEYTFVTDILTNIDKQKKEIISLTSNILERNVTIKLILNSSKKEKSKIKLVTIPNFEVKTSIVTEKKNGNDISGDSYLSTELQDLKHLNILSDGAGSGKEAAKSSQTIINLIEKLLESGFDEKSAVKIINSFIKLKGNGSISSTLDVFIVDLKTAKAEFIKLGAAPTYILKDSKVTTLSNMNIPIGLLNESEYVPIVNDLTDGTLVVQITDGVINEDYDYINNYLTKYLQSLDTTKSVKVIAEEIHKLILKEKNNNIDDDFTVLVTKVCKS